MSRLWWPVPPDVRGSSRPVATPHSSWQVSCARMPPHIRLGKFPVPECHTGSSRHAYCSPKLPANWTCPTARNRPREEAREEGQRPAAVRRPSGLCFRSGMKAHSRPNLLPTDTLHTIEVRRGAETGQKLLRQRGGDLPCHGRGGKWLDGRGHPARVCLRIFEASGCGEWPTALIEQLGPHHYGGIYLLSLRPAGPCMLMQDHQFCMDV